MTINVGIGTGDVQQQQQFLMQIAQAQAVVAQSPMAGKLIDPKRIYNVQARLAENAGFKNPAEFWVDPETAPPSPPPQPDPKVMLEQAKLQDGQNKTVAEMQWNREKHQMELQFKAEQAERDRQHQIELELIRQQARMTEPVMPLPAMPMGEMETEDEGEGEEQLSTQDLLMAQVAQSLQMLAQAMNAPKQVIRDETGRAVGVVPMTGE
jgi:hypothetical protein